MNYIIYSKKENFFDGAKKIKEESNTQNKDCELVEIEEFLIGNFLDKLQKNSVYYFLTNAPIVSEIAEDISKKDIDCKIVNKNSMPLSLSKLEVQIKIRAGGICTPENYAFENLNATKYPVYIKSISQCSDVYYIKNQFELQNTITKLDPKKYYIEEAIEDDSMILDKIYFIEGNTYSLNGEIALNWIQLICTEISEILQIQVFSIDSFLNNRTEEYFCIDVNLASSFFMQNNARKAFVKYILR